MRPPRGTLFALPVALTLVALAAAGCKSADVKVVPASGPPAQTEVSGDEAAPTTGAAPTHPRPLIGIQGGDLVLYDPDAGVSSGLVAGVNATGVLAIHPDGEWIVIQTPRRWDGLDICEAVAANVQTGSVWRLSECAGREVHIRPLGWSDHGMYYEPDSAFSSEPAGYYEWDFNAGTVTAVPALPAMEAWQDFGEAWSVPLSVPDPDPGDGIDFWAIGAADVSTEGKEAVAWLQPGWLDSSLDEQFPVYLLEEDGTSKRLPLQRPVVFAETLGFH